MSKTFGMLAHTLSATDWVQGWYASRKLNGWCCLWDGGLTRGQLVIDVPWSSLANSRGPITMPATMARRATGLWTLGRTEGGVQPIFAPDWWLDKLPKDIPTHGELWHRTDDISKVKSICGQGEVRGTRDERWEQIQYLAYNVKPYSVYDVGLCNDTMRLFAANDPWEVRMRLAKEEAQRQGKFANDVFSFHEQVLVNDASEIPQLLETFGGEGICLVNPRGPYEMKRSRHLLKVKGVFETEARVVSHQDGAGKHLGRCGAVGCILTWDDSVESFYGGNVLFTGKTVSFKIGGGLSNEQREWSWIEKNLPVGSSVHFSFLGVSSLGVPYSCNYIGPSEKE